jgi:hypothetical protein
MSKRQIDSCAARLSGANRDEFLRMMAAAEALWAQAAPLITEAAALRREAWQLYRANRTEAA